MVARGRCIFHIVLLVLTVLNIYSLLHGSAARSYRFIRSSSSSSPSSSPNATAQAGSSTMTRVNAAIVILTRNSELDELLDTLHVFEMRFNRRFGYPYVFLNDQNFTDEFRVGVVSMLPVDRQVEFGMVPPEHWSYPDYIDQARARASREAMAKLDVPYGDSEPYRFMCRYQSGYFFRHPLLLKYEYYWRVEPSTRLLCDVPRDPFVRMVQARARYGFTIAIQEYRETVRTLYAETRRYALERRKNHPDFNPPLLGFFEEQKEEKKVVVVVVVVTEEEQGDSGNDNEKDKDNANDNANDHDHDNDHDDGRHSYNMCHFWSNFEIGYLPWLRSEEYLSYFEHLDRAGGYNHGCRVWVSLIDHPPASFMSVGATHPSIPLALDCS